MIVRSFIAKQSTIYYRLRINSILVYCLLSPYFQSMWLYNWVTKMNLFSSYCLYFQVKWGQYLHIWQPGCRLIWTIYLVYLLLKLLKTRFNPIKAIYWYDCEWLETLWLHWRDEYLKSKVTYVGLVEIPSRSLLWWNEVQWRVGSCIQESWYCMVVRSPTVDDEFRIFSWLCIEIQTGKTFCNVTII